MTVVLLHALPLDGSMWSTEVRGLAAPTVTPDLYALGDSIEAWAVGVLDLVPSGPLVLVGNSVGGSCAIEVAHLAPDRVERIVLLAAKPGHRAEPDLRDAALRCLADEGLDVAWERFWSPLFGPDAKPAAIDAARQIAIDQDVDDVIRGVQVVHSRPDRSTFLSSWSGPVHVVAGVHDVAPRGGDRLAASLSNATFHPIAGAGHYVTFERPDATLAVLRQVIGQHGSHRKGDAGEEPGR